VTAIDVCVPCVPTWNLKTPGPEATRRGVPDRRIPVRRGGAPRPSGALDGARAFAAARRTLTLRASELLTEAERARKLVRPREVLDGRVRSVSRHC